MITAAVFIAWREEGACEVVRGSGGREKGRRTRRECLRDKKRHVERDEENERQRATESDRDKYARTAVRGEIAVRAIFYYMAV